MDGMISVGSETGTRWGLTCDRFALDTYLWRIGNVVIVSFVASTVRGAFGDLVRRIQADGLDVDVPTPVAHMRAILEKWGAVARREWASDMGDSVEMWRVPTLPARARLGHATATVP